MLLRLAFSNLFHRKTRTAMSVLAVAMEVALVLVLIGLSKGTVSESGQRIENLRSDIIILPPGAQVMMGVSSATMPIDEVTAAIATIDGIVGATPVTFASANFMGGIGLVFGIDSETYHQAGRGAFSFLSGHDLEAADDLVIDARLARAHHVEVGDSVELLNSTFRVCGIIRDGAGVRMYLPLTTLQDLIGRKDRASVFFVRLRDEGKVEAVVDGLGKRLADYKVFASKRYTEMLSESTTGLKEFHAAITAIAVVFGSTIILLSMYTTIFERTRQIGVMKSLGADRRTIVAEVLLEAVFLSIMGIPAGMLLAVVTRTGVGASFPTLNIVFTPEWMIYASALAIGSCILGAVFPAYLAASVDPVEALTAD